VLCFWLGEEVKPVRAAVPKGPSILNQVRRHFLTLYSLAPPGAVVFFQMWGTGCLALVWMRYYGRPILTSYL
jgi:hypothetical protein